MNRMAEWVIVAGMFVGWLLATLGGVYVGGDFGGGIVFFGYAGWLLLIFPRLNS